VIIKSMSRKEASFRQLIEYMEKDQGEVAFGHNLCGDPFGRREDVILEFERNAAKLRSRKNGNTLYHEVISLEAGTKLRKEEIVRILGQIGLEYVSRRAPHQMALGIVHTDAKHIHLHICLSANAVGKDRPERLSKKAFADIQKEMEKVVRERWAELSQSSVYGKERKAERLKTTSAEQEMRKRTGEPSRKEDIKVRVHGIFQRAGSPEELVSLLRAEGLEFYQRGKTVGLVESATGRKHRLSTLGVGEHYEATISRLFGGQKEPEPTATRSAKPAEKSSERQTAPPAGNDQAADRRRDERQPRQKAPGREERTPETAAPPTTAPQAAPEPPRRSEAQPPREPTRQPQEPPQRPPDREPTRERQDGPVPAAAPTQEERRRSQLRDLFRGKDRTRDKDRER
jgi:hypothetical protein